MELSDKPHPGRTAQIEITGDKMGHGMPELEHTHRMLGLLEEGQSVPSCFEFFGEAV